MKLITMQHALPSTHFDSCSEGLLYCLSTYVNNVTNGFFWTAALITFGVVLMIITQRFGSTKAFGYASVVCLFAAMWLAVLGLMPWWTAALFILIGVVGIVSLILSEK